MDNVYNNNNNNQNPSRKRKNFNFVWWYDCWGDLIGNKITDKTTSVGKTKIKKKRKLNK